MNPDKIQRTGTEGIEIQWQDGSTSKISSRILRMHCPSAVSKAKRGDESHEKPLGAKPSLLKVVEATAEEETRLDEIWMIGNYAIGMKWGDGHNTGIYTFAFLRELAELKE